MLIVELGGLMTVLAQLDQQDASVAASVRDLDDGFNTLTKSSQVRSLRDLPSLFTKTFDQLMYSAVGDVVGPDPVRHSLGYGGPPGGIFGVGASRFKDELRPAVFLDARQFGEAVTMDPLPLIETGHFDNIERSLERAIGRETVALLLPRPSFFAQPLVVGTGISVGSVSGVCGVEVNSVVHGRCVLTAGHVAQQVGLEVRAGGRKIGTTVFADHVRLHAVGDIVADVGVVRLDESVTVHNPRGPVIQGQGKELDPVVAETLAGPTSAWVRSVMTSFLVDKEYGRLGNVLLTDKTISRRGDSGSPVYLDDGRELGASTVVGHIVAGAPPVYSIVQDVSYVLESAQVSLT